MKQCFFIVILLYLLCFPAAAAQVTVGGIDLTLPDSIQNDTLDDLLQEQTNEQDGFVSFALSLLEHQYTPGEMLAALWERICDKLLAILAGGAAGACALGLCAVGNSLFEGTEKREEIITLAGGLALFALGANHFTQVSEEGVFCIDRICTLASGLLPAMAALLVSTGRTVSSSLLPAAALGCCTAFSSLLKGPVLQLTRSYIGICAADSLLLQGRFSKAAGLLKGVVLWGVGICATLFSALMGLQAIGGNALDTLTVKAARFAVGNFVPVVGKALADASATLFAGAAAVKSAFGLAGIVICLLLCLTPLLRAALFGLLWRLLGALAHALDLSGLCELCEGMAGGFTVLCAMTACQAAVLMAGLFILIGQVS